MTTIPDSILALDVGEQRVGVAVANLVARLPKPLDTLNRSETFFAELQRIISIEQAAAIVIGYPRGLGGQTTAQTQTTEAFSTELKQHCSLPVYFQDESLTSKKAEAELEARGIAYRRGAVDALAATYILEDFLAEHANELGKINAQQV